MNSEAQTQALLEILLQLQLSAARVTDVEFKRMGTKDLMSSIQNCKKLIEYSKTLSIYEQIAQYSEESYSDSLGISNII